MISYILLMQYCNILALLLLLTLIFQHEYTLLSLTDLDGKISYQPQILEVLACGVMVAPSYVPYPSLKRSVSERDKTRGFLTDLISLF